MNASASHAPASVAIAATAALAAPSGQPASTPLTRVALAYIEPRFKLYLRFGDVPLVAGIFFGLKPAVTALVLHAAHRIGTRALKNRWMWGIAAASFIAIFAFDTPFPAIVGAAGLIGHFGARRWPQVFALGGGHGSAKASYGPALIDDNTPTPMHARFSRSHLAKVLVFGLGLWLLAIAVLIALNGLQGTLTSFQDVHDPAWEPRGFDPSQCRKVVTDPPQLAARILTPPIHDALMRPWDDVTIRIDTAAVRLATQQQASVDLGYFGGCPFHRHPDGGTMEHRFLVGPPWWIDLLCGIADAVDA